MSRCQNFTITLYIQPVLQYTENTDEEEKEEEEEKYSDEEEDEEKEEDEEDTYEDEGKKYMAQSVDT